MKPEIERQRLEVSVRLAKEWKNSGMTQAEFARQKGLTYETVRYHVLKVREIAPERMEESTPAETEFVAVPPAHLNRSGRTSEELPLTDQPVLMIQSAGACLQATNQIEPHLLKTALEVMMTC